MKTALLLFLSCLCSALADRRGESESDLVVKPDSYKQNCQEGDVWRDEDCNRCECDDVAKTAVCTRRKCSDGQKLTVTSGWQSQYYGRRRRDVQQQLLVKPDSYKPGCREGDRWTDERCNKCKCVDEKAVCTRKLCPGGRTLSVTDGWQGLYDIDPDHRRTRRETQPSDAVVKPDSYKSDCHPQDTWTDQDCNSCHCGHDKKAVCTRRTCSDGQRLQPTPDWQHALNLRH